MYNPQEQLNHLNLPEDRLDNFSRPAHLGLSLALLLFWLNFLNGCGATYPVNDTFNTLYSGVEDYFYLTNVGYEIVGGSPPNIISTTTANQLLLVMNQRDDIYYPKGVSFDFKSFDTRLLLQITNLTTNYLIFSNTNFPSDIMMSYYNLEGKVVEFTNGYLMMTQASPAANWMVTLNVSNQNVSQSYEREHVRGSYAGEQFYPEQ